VEKLEFLKYQTTVVFEVPKILGLKFWKTGHLMKPTNTLLPERHPNKNFFIADIFDNLPIKDDMASMGHPMFSLSKNKDFRQIDYKNGDVAITIAPSTHGLPTIFDKDVLLYCGSLLMDQVNKGLTPPKTLRISSNDLLIATNRSVGGRGYDLLENALKRLHGVSITTNIKTNGMKQVTGFHLIESFVFIESSFVKDRRVALEITLSDWFYNSIVGKEVLTINRDYFRLGKALERRLYEIARKHCGTQAEWAISLEGLREKTGSTSISKMFRFVINAIVETNYLPDYTLHLSDKDMVTFRNRHAEKEQTDLFNLPTIAAATIRRGAALVEDAGTGWDYSEIRAQFTQQLVDGFKPKNANGAFINFVKKKVKNLP
jgi:plasmid replication initiation protein